MCHNFRQCHLKFIIIFILIIFFFTTNIYPQFPVDQSKVSVDLKIHCLGLGQTVTNLGFGSGPWANFDYPENCPPSEPKIFNGIQLPGATRCALFLGGKRGAEKIFSSSEWESYNNPGGYQGFEFFPTGESWDTIWVVKKDEVVDIPYWPNYKGISDEDFVCRYSDDLIFVPDQVKPLHVEVIQTSHSWGINSYNVWTYYRFYIIAKEYDIEDLHIGWWKFGGNGVGYPGSRPSDDDIQSFDIENKITFEEDQPGGNDLDGMGPRGFKIWPPKDVNPEKVIWSFDNQILPMVLDDFMHESYFSGVIDPPDNVGPAGWGGFSTTAIGAFNLKSGDTLRIQIANVSGVDKEDVLKSIERLEKMIERDFALPSAPPGPPLRVEVGNHQVTLKWDSRPGDIDPEAWTDPYREDIHVEPQPFEGYRIYKSFYENGPWTLLAEFDIPDNEFGKNIGLQHEFIDKGLLNNFNYYYSVISFTKPDVLTGFPELTTPINQNTVMVIPGTQVPETVGEVFVVPNPYRADARYQDYTPPWEKPDPRRNINNEPGKDRWIEVDRRIQFVNVPSPSTIKIYTLSGDLIQNIYHNDPEIGIKDWNLLSRVGQTIASGIYLYTVEDEKTGKVQVGKFVIIK